VEFTLLVLPDALRILEKYDGKLPIISNVKYNEYLKVLAQAAGIDKPISSHWARHTGATLLLNAGVEMEIVAKILGHSSTKITRAVYAKLLDSTVADAMESISSKF
jgi:site-specific recombinase XerD